MRTHASAVLVAVLVSAGLVGCRAEAETESPAPDSSGLLIAPPIVVSHPAPTTVSLPVTSKARQPSKPRSRIG